MADAEPTYPSPKDILAAHGLRPRKRLGQNFLVDPRFAQRVANTLPADPYVIEIGAGTGTLTAALAKNARSVLALELDRGLVTLLRERFTNVKNVMIVESDALDFDFGEALRCQAAPRIVSGNLPYYITTPLIERMLDSIDAWEGAVLMVQREYARRLLANPGTADFSSLTLFVGYHCQVEKLFEVGAAGFYPAPSVASTVVRLTPRQDRANGVVDEALMLRTIRAAFAQRRKTLANCLVAAAGHNRAAIDAAMRASHLRPDIRGERLSLDDVRRLANALAAAGIDLL